MDFFLVFVLLWPFPEQAHLISLYLKRLNQRYKEHVISLSQTNLFEAYCNNYRNELVTSKLYDTYFSVSIIWSLFSQVSANIAFRRKFGDRSSLGKIFKGCY